MNTHDEAKVLACARRDMTKAIEQLNEIMDRMLEQTGGESGRDFTADEQRFFNAVTKARNDLLYV